jgi:hypothetical protein
MTYALRSKLTVKTTNIICAPPALATLTISFIAFRALLQKLFKTFASLYLHRAKKTVKIVKISIFNYAKMGCGLCREILNSSCIIFIWNANLQACKSTR